MDFLDRDLSPMSHSVSHPSSPAQGDRADAFSIGERFIRQLRASVRDKAERGLLHGNSTPRVGSKLGELSFIYNCGTGPRHKPPTEMPAQTTVRRRLTVDVYTPGTSSIIIVS